MTHEIEANSGDAILTAVLANRFDGIVREMTNTLLRAGRSAVINVARDFSCAICTGDAELFTCAEGIPVHVFGVHNQAKAMKDFHPHLREGDAFIDNDPYVGNSHPADHAILVPVIFEGEHLFTAVAKAHQADTGNAEPTTYRPSAKDVYEEGALIFPVVQIQREYEMIDDIVRMCRRRIRVPDQWYGDLLAAVGAARIAERRLKELCTRYGKEKIKAFTRDWLNYSQQRMADAIAKTPAAKIRVSGAHDPLAPFLPGGVPINVAFEIIPDQGRIIVDLTDNLPNLDCGMNLTEATATASVLAGIFNALETGIPQNQGSFRCIDVKLADGCVVGRPKFPHSCSVATTNVADRLIMMIGRGFSQLGDGFGLAEGGTGMGIGGAVVSGADARLGDDAFVNHLVVSANGGPASPSADGWVTYGLPCVGGLMYRDSIEVDELKMPILFKEVRLKSGSGGAGRYRGGPALEVIYGPTENPITVAYIQDGQFNAPAGAAGGHDGSLGASWKIRADGSEERIPNSNIIKIEKGELVRGLDAAGGGYGDPATRDVEAVRHDVAEGWETLDRASEIYKVAFSGCLEHDTLSVDIAATNLLRKNAVTTI